ncbi:uncharacterized protein LOC130589787 [Beta vulgaris subsp. vulgaris]|uniref:uncharacterized protein LOC130589787 n=1 Tax=Beta vulgaris subsp. vulgaris TaxID=3555 RepID=UPI0025474A89|nr:uncharacterized protein LOC130589787 [Beta vulgaris subsp. vulgaris]
MLSDEVTPTPKKQKGISGEAVRSSSQLHSAGSASQFSPSIDDRSFLDSLTEDCRELAVTLALAVADDDAVGVTLPRSLFHYSKDDGTAFLTKEDIGQFLKGEMINISIIQVYMRAT